VQAPTRIALLVSSPEKSALGTTIVERAWLETWLTSSIRVDRATYLVRSTNDTVALQLPPDAIREHRIHVRVNRQPIPLNITQAGTLAIPISPEQQDRAIEISVDYRYAFNMPSIEVPIILPTFGNDTTVQYQFWQVLLQPDKHIISIPPGWTLEYDWSWNGLFWWRIPSIRKSDIGFGSDATTPEPTQSESNQYVFSHLQPPKHVTLYIVNRSLIVFCSSGIALLIGLVLIYVPQTRYAGSLLGLAIAFVAVLFYQPPFVLLMLQAAVFGVFLALGTGYVYRIFHHQKPWVPSAFPMAEDVAQSAYWTPVQQSQTVHEVIMDETSNNAEVLETPTANNGQS
jgi:hypothetical protein